MTNRINRSSCAFHAIAASLALCSTPLLAQDISPAPAADPAPVVVLPAQPAAAPPPAAAPVATAPVEAPVTAPANDAPPVRAAPKARPAPAARAISVAPRVAREAAASAAPVVAAKPLSATLPSRAPVPSAVTPAPGQDIAPARAPVAEAAQPADNSAILGLGALAALGLVGLGVFATRRRRVVLTDDEACEPYEPVDTTPASVAPAAIVAPDYATYALADSEVLNETVNEPPRIAPVSSYSLPDGPVPTGEARQQLIERMAAAAPDAANPFTSAKGRRRRARMILQARENDQRNAGQDGFDWRNFPTTRDVAPERAEPVADRMTVDA